MTRLKLNLDKALTLVSLKIHRIINGLPDDALLGYSTDYTLVGNTSATS